MKCKNHLCVFEEGGLCFYRKISLDENGMCECCVIVRLDEEKLEMEKIKQRNELLSE